MTSPPANATARASSSGHTSPVTPASAGGRIQSVERAARILSAFAAPEQQLTVSDLARMLEVHKSTASRLVGTLVASGLLARGATDDRLSLGPELERLGRLAAGRPDLLAFARPVMDELSAATGEGSTLSVPQDGRAATVAQSHGTYLVGAQSWVGLAAPPHATADGKILLAYRAVDTPAELEACTVATTTDAQVLRTELADVRRRGWAVSRGEFEAGLHGVAAPILDGERRCVGALCVSGPSYRLTDDALGRLGVLCLAAADRISAALRFGTETAPAPAGLDRPALQPVAPVPAPAADCPPVSVAGGAR